MTEVTLLYLHGIGNNQLRRSEAHILERHRRRGITVVAAFIDWEASETFPALLDRITQEASDLLDSMSNEEILLLEGSSAGGPLAINTLKRLNDPCVRAITHSSRLQEGKLHRWDPRTLERCAHLGTNRASQSFYDCVKYCENETIPALSEAEKGNIITTKQLADEIVPISTMTIEGARSVTIPIIGHKFGIALGMLLTPSLVEQLQ